MASLSQADTRELHTAMSQLSTVAARLKQHETRALRPDEIESAAIVLKDAHDRIKAIWSQKGAFPQ